MDSEIQEKIQELQVLEQNLQAFIMQKQSVQLETNEVANALEEIEKSDGEVYKIIGGAMIKSTKDKLSKELREKKKLFDLRLNSLEKQESLLMKKAEDLRGDVNSALTKKKE